MKTVAGTSEAFDIRVGVHKGSALNPQLFITVMEEATKLARGWSVLTAESKEEVTDMFNRKEGMETVNKHGKDKINGDWK